MVLFIHSFIWFWLLALCCCMGSSLAVSCHCSGFSCFRAWALGRTGFSSCGSSALESRLNSRGAQGFVALRHVGSSRFRDRTCVSCIGRRILYHRATRETPRLVSFNPGGIQQCLETLVATDGGMLLASHGWRPGLLLPILHSPGCPHSCEAPRCQ